VFEGESGKSVKGLEGKMFGGLKSFSSDSSGFMLDDLNNVEKC
jgi:hypothetical protein